MVKLSASFNKGILWELSIKRCYISLHTIPLIFIHKVKIFLNFKEWPPPNISFYNFFKSPKGQFLCHCCKHRMANKYTDFYIKIKHILVHARYKLIEARFSTHTISKSGLSNSAQPQHYTKISKSRSLLATYFSLSL